MKYLVKICICACAVLILSCNASQQVPQQHATTTLINSKRYTFVATRVIPTEDPRMNVRNLFPNATDMYQLTSRYDLRVTPDSVAVYLPFFGRSYTAPMNPSEGGIKFTSVKFSYTSKSAKRGYDITIIPKDHNDVQQLSLSVSQDGYATLRVTSINKSFISYYGQIEPNK